MDLEQRVGSFYTAGVGLLTSLICFALLSLLGFVVYQAYGRFSADILMFCTAIALLAAWFGKLSYQLLGCSTKQDAYLLSPFSMLCIFLMVGGGVVASIFYSLSAGNIENGVLGILIFILLFPAANYCWKSAKKNAARQ
ncbi:hypothetical protein [Neiella marina]|uniref:hypothetical protein n=1 Tax=Neiella marina TaxID=508461 RepID=UPI000B3C1705|nr:hypothetical protein [Neiella marina]